MTAKNPLTFPLLMALMSAIGLWLAWESLTHHTALVHGLNSAESALCNISASINCDAVNKSSWSYFLGLPIASYGILYYLGLLGSAALGIVIPERARPGHAHALTAITACGVVLSVVLFLIAKLLIGALCPLCLATYALNGLLFWIAWRENRGIPIGRRVSEGLLAIWRGARELISPSSNRNWLTAVGHAGLILGAVFFALHSPEFALQTIRSAHTAKASPLGSAEQKKLALENAVRAWEAAPTLTLPPHIRTLADYTIGPEHAPIEVIEFSDFQCPFCRNLFASLEPILERYKGKVRLTLLNFPIDNSCNPQIPRPGHQFACYAASFSICAGEQGRFWDTARYLFTLPELESDVSKERGIEAIDAALLRLSLDSDAMRECLGSSRPVGRLAADVQAAVAVGLTGTPLLIINGRAVSPPMPDTVAAIFSKIAGPAPLHEQP